MRYGAIRRIVRTAAAPVLLAAALTPSAHANPAPYVNWPDQLPALPTALNPQPGPQPGCSTATIGCLDYEISQMRAAQQRFGCDHRGVFATTYLVLTETLRNTLAANPNFFDDRSYLIYEDALFASYYFRTVSDYEAGRLVPAAWQTAFQTAASGDANAAQDMLLGINAHVQRDMPYVMATLGLHRHDGSSRKADHDRFNQILDAAYGPVVQAIAARYDAAVNYTNPNTPADNLGGLELVKVWRENVWRNAERLLNASTAEQRQQVEQAIESNAESSARSIAAIQTPPGYRAQRDAYCAAHLPSAGAIAVTSTAHRSKATSARPKKPHARRRAKRRRKHRHHRRHRAHRRAPRGANRSARKP